MKTTYAIPLLLLLLTPAATAIPDPDEQVDAILRQDSGMQVVSSIRWNNLDNATWNGTASFWLPGPVEGLAVLLSGTGNPQTTLEPSAYSMGQTDGDFQELRVNLTQAAATVDNGTTVVLVAHYRIAQDHVTMRTYYATEKFTLFASGGEGYEAAVTPDGFASQHASPVGGPIQADETYQVEFSTVAGTGLRDQYVWAVAGVLAGLFLMYVFIRQGWIKSPTKTRKFVKGGAMESKSTLEARRRTLLAALKELEHAHDAKEVDDDVYLPLKEEYKAQAVRVMRSLEEKKDS